MKANPTRTCVVTRESYPQAQLLRCVAGPNATVYFDLKGNAPGRGAYVHPSSLANTKKLTKALARPLDGAQLPENFTQTTQELLEKSLYQQIGTLRGAAQVLCGLGGVKDLQQKQQLAMVMHVADIGQDAAQKLSQLNNDEIDVYSYGNREKLALALGQPDVAVVACTARAASALKPSLEKLLGIQSVTG